MQVSHTMLLCLLLVISTILTGNLTIGLLSEFKLWPPYAMSWDAVSSRNEVHFQFSLYRNVIIPERKFHSWVKPEMNSFRNDLCVNEILSRYHVNRFREIYGDGMNSLPNGSRSAITLKLRWLEWLLNIRPQSFKRAIEMKGSQKVLLLFAVTSKIFGQNRVTENWNGSMIHLKIWMPKFFNKKFPLYPLYHIDFSDKKWQETFKTSSVFDWTT